jgi:outer membrane protein OmpA-like peptidoglycan-associated protein
MDIGGCNSSFAAIVTFNYLIKDIMKNILLSVAIIGMMYSQNTLAQIQDAEGCTDHPLLNRFPNYFIDNCSNNFDKLDFLNKEGEPESFEGMLVRKHYQFNGESKTNRPSVYQVLKNYENAITKIGGKKVFMDGGNGCFTIRKNSKDYKIMVNGFESGVEPGVDDFTLYILEMEEMKQEVVANEILDALNKDGYIALNILFETNKSTIQTESQGIVDQIFKMLSDNPAIKVSIEGHTDNVGDAANNKKLSEARAKSVNEALISKGIDKSRLAYKGWGQEKPIADNRSEEGRAKNRRVEIVKK